jgi:C-terminal processing protease CtpA/Prc
MNRPRSLVVAIVLALVARRPAVAQAPTGEEIHRSHQMLKLIRDDLKKYYYDSTFGGSDFDRRFRDADAKIGEAATLNDLVSAVAQFVLDFHDSHTVFLPPGRAADVEYGWDWTSVGENCFVDTVVSGSDADFKGLRAGDQVMEIDGIAVNRQSSNFLNYLYNGLSPRAGMHVQLKHPDGTAYEVDVMAKVTPRERVVDYGEQSTWSFLLTRMEDESHARRHFWREFGDTALVWHFGEFAYDDEGIDQMMERAATHQYLILDLRNNGGGAEEAITRLIGHFIDHPQRIARLPRRNKTDSLVAKPRGKTPYRGKVIVLVNANSASASEVTARFLQLEGVATVVGDRSMGAVMSAQIFAHDVGFQKYITFGLEVTVQDVVMNDGARLENASVTPEWIVLPTGADIAAKRDPQMVKALALAGIQIDPAHAAKIYAKDFTRP